LALVKSSEEIVNIGEGGRITAAALDVGGSMAQEGVSTREIDDAIEAYIVSCGAYPSFKGLRGFPAASCISVNHEVVHGIPGQKTLREGDIVSIDVGVRFKGLYSDAARTFAVGDIDRDARKLLEVTRQALLEGIRFARVGCWMRDLSSAIQQHVESAGLYVVRDLVGHGVGHYPHEDPQVPNYAGHMRGRRLKEGMVLAIEPMVNVGTPKVRTLADGWTVVTADGSLSAHFEHTVAVRPDGGQVLTAL
jgi:methionyl aminopeptidase